MKKIVVILLVGVLLISMASCNRNEVIDEKPVVVMITDVGGLGDQSRNDAIWNGCEQASDEYNVDIRCLESESTEDYASNIAVAREEKAILTICVGEEFAPYVKEEALNHPEQQFLLIDGEVDLNNVTNYIFNDQQSGFLAGVAAGLTTTTNQIGFIGGVQTTDTLKAQYGFMAGVKTIKPEAEVIVEYANDIKDRKLGETLAAAEHDQGVDVIYQVANATGIGVIDSAEDLGIYVIGEIKDQSGLDSKNVLCSTTKNYKSSVKKEIKKAKNNNLKGETIILSLENDGVTLSDNAGNIPYDVEAIVELWKEKITKGEFVVPYDEESFLTFVPPTQ